MFKSISNEFDLKMMAALKAHDLSLEQFGILMTLLEKDGISQSEIGKKISIPGYATTRNIDKLEKKGLLKRHKDKTSRRSFSIRLSNEGKELAPKLFLTINQINKQFSSVLEEDEIQILTGLLKKMVEGAKRDS